MQEEGPSGEKSTQLPPLDLPLPLVTLPPPLPDYVEPGKTRVTTLPNGVKIASETSTSPVSSIGMYVECGSIYETPISSGASHLLERLAFKSTTNRSHLRVVREVEAIGGNITVSVTREQMCYTYDALKTYMPEMLEVLVDCVRNPVFLDWEVNEQLQKVKSELGEISNNPEGLILEVIHSVGFSGAMANPLMAHESAINRLNASILEEFVAVNREHMIAPSLPSQSEADLARIRNMTRPEAAAAVAQAAAKAEAASLRAEEAAREVYIAKVEAAAASAFAKATLSTVRSRNTVKMV